MCGTLGSSTILTRGRGSGVGLADGVEGVGCVVHRWGRLGLVVESDSISAMLEETV